MEGTIKGEYSAELENPHHPALETQHPSQWALRGHVIRSPKIRVVTSDGSMEITISKSGRHHAYMVIQISSGKVTDYNVLLEHLLSRATTDKRSLTTTTPSANITPETRENHVHHEEWWRSMTTSLSYPRKQDIWVNHTQDQTNPRLVYPRGSLYHL